MANPEEAAEKADDDKKAMLESGKGKVSFTTSVETAAPGLFSSIQEIQKTASQSRMWLVTAAYLIPNFCVGLAMTFSVTGLPHYQGEFHVNDNVKMNNIIPAEVAPVEEANMLRLTLDEDQGSWFESALVSERIVSVISLCMMVGTLLGGCVVEKLGCKWTLYISHILEVAGWIAIYYANSFPILMLGRVFTGLGSGLSTPATYLILADISLIRFRGIMSVLNSSICNVGWLVGLVIGKYVSLETLIITYSILPALYLIVSPILPESPLWLTKQGRDEEAVKHLISVRGASYPVQVEAKELIACVEEARNSTRGGSLKAKVKYYFCAREFLCPMAILFALSFVQGSSGVDTLSYYSLKIFRHAKISMSPYLMSVFLQVGYTAGYLFMSPFVEKVNRRVLFCTAALFMAGSLAFLSCGMPAGEVIPDDFEATDKIDKVLAEDGDKLEYIQQLLMPVAVVLFSLSYGAGFGPSIYTWSSELFPPRGRGVGCSVSLSVRYVVAASMLKLYPWLLHNLGLAHLFGLHAAIVTVGAIFVMFVVPETRGLSNSQLAKLFATQTNATTTFQDPASRSTLYTEVDVEAEAEAGVPTSETTSMTATDTTSVDDLGKESDGGSEEMDGLIFKATSTADA